MLDSKLPPVAGHSPATANPHVAPIACRSCDRLAEGCHNRRADPTQEALTYGRASPSASRQRPFSASSRPSRDLAMLPGAPAGGLRPAAGART